eukprot:4940583-Prymnesium_polylepis.1
MCTRTEGRQCRAARHETSRISRALPRVRRATSNQQLSAYAILAEMFSSRPSVVTHPIASIKSHP